LTKSNGARRPLLVKPSVQHPNPIPAPRVAVVASVTTPPLRNPNLQRFKGQTVRVERVTVESRGQAVVWNVIKGGTR
jgi:hypothetical protein